MGFGSAILNSSPGTYDTSTIDNLLATLRSVPPSGVVGPFRTGDSVMIDSGPMPNVRPVLVRGGATSQLLGPLPGHVSLLPASSPFPWVLAVAAVGAYFFLRK